MDLRFAICDLQLTRPEPRAARVQPQSLPTELNPMTSTLQFRNPRSAIRNPHSPSARPAFSFTEILFAIMILGIGFIMVAAMFPVALSQTESSSQETIGAASA